MFRLQCEGCKKYFDFCCANPISRGTCPHCGEYLINKHRIVPWWYGRPIPGWLNIKWKDKIGRTVLIPEFYLEVHIWLMGEKGEKISPEDAIRYFVKSAKDTWGSEVEIISNKVWEEHIDSDCY
jgi:hypothetical protein